MPNQDFKYSNGVDHLKALPALVNRIKWLSEIASPSESGRYFDDGSFHASVSEATLRATQPNATINDSDFNTVFKPAFKNGVITKLLNKIFCEEELIEQTLLYDLHEQQNVVQMPNAEFVGYELKLAPSLDYSLQLLNAVFHFDAAASFKLYIYSDGEPSPFWEQTITLTAGGYQIIALEKCFLSYSGRKNTRFFIGYKPAEVTGAGQPYVDNQIMEFQTCMFSAKQIHGSIPLLTTNLLYPSGQIGFNLEVKTFNDYTNRVVTNPSAFDEMIGLQNAVHCIEFSLFSTRKNPEKRDAVDNADRYAMLLELTGTLPVTDAPQILGLRSSVSKQMEKLKKSFIRKKTGIVSDGLTC